MKALVLGLAMVAMIATTTADAATCGARMSYMERLAATIRKGNRQGKNTFWLQVRLKLALDGYREDCRNVPRHKHRKTDP